MGFRGHITRILAFARDTHRVHGQVNTLLKHFGDYIDAREVVAQQSRLAGLQQHGHKTNREQVGDAFPINRFHHSRMVAVNALIFALCAGREIEEAIEATEGAWRHDSMHPAYCHVAEYVIIERPFDIEPHEDRGMFAAMDDPELRKLITTRGLSQANVVRAMLERGAFPTQSIADTAAYVEHDGHFIGEPVSDDFIWRIAQSIKGAAASRLIVDDPTAIEEMLTKRARYHQLFYSSWCGRVIDVAIGDVLRFALKRHLLSMNDVTHGTDTRVNERFMEMLRGEHDIPDWVASLLKVARGDMKELQQNWQERTYKKARTYEQQLKRLRERRKDVVAVPARNFNNKRIRIISTTGIESDVTPSVTLNPEDRTWYIYTFK